MEKPVRVQVVLPADEVVRLDAMRQKTGESLSAVARRMVIAGMDNCRSGGGRRKG